MRVLGGAVATFEDGGMVVDTGIRGFGWISAVLEHENLNAYLKGAFARWSLQQ